MVNQLYRSKSTHLQSLKHSKIHFWENHVPNLIKPRLKYLPKAIKAFKKIVKEDKIDIIRDKAITMSKNIV